MTDTPMTPRAEGETMANDPRPSMSKFLTAADYNAAMDAWIKRNPRASAFTETRCAPNIETGRECDNPQSPCRCTPPIAAGGGTDITPPASAPGGEEVLVTRDQVLSFLRACGFPHDDANLSHAHLMLDCVMRSSFRAAVRRAAEQGRREALEYAARHTRPTYPENERDIINGLAALAAGEIKK